MSVVRVTRELAEELAALTSAQRRAATCVDDVVMLAGPGSGKTRTIVARVAYLLETRPSPFRGVACITYTNSAANEVRTRLERMGQHSGRLLVSSTVHSFCLQQILRPYSTIAGREPLGPGAVLDSSDALALWERIFAARGIQDQARYALQIMTRIRRALASGEPTDRYDDRYVVAAREFEAQLELDGTLDFEAMAFWALKILRTTPRAREALVARFPHLVIDEYQDLGSVLHDLVLELRDAGAKITAVGDADQTIFEFTGSDPKYLNSLGDEHGFTVIRLGTNFRSGPAIVAASKTALGEERDHQSVEGAAPGEVVLRKVRGGYDTHSNMVIDEINGAIAKGVSPNEIAILYPRNGPLLTLIRSALDDADIDVLFEKDNRLPPGSLSSLVQQCATRLLAFSPLSDLVDRGGAPKQAALLRAFTDLQVEARVLVPDMFTARRTLYELTDGHDSLNPDETAAIWLGELSERLALGVITERSSERASARALDFYKQEGDALRLRDLAWRAYDPRKVVLTTYHMAKGREFDVVVLPGLVEREVPKWEYAGWNRVRSPSLKSVSAQRREFYVAMTRARHRLILITGDWYTAWKGEVHQTGPSRYITDLLA